MDKCLGLLRVRVQTIVFSLAVAVLSGCIRDGGGVITSDRAFLAAGVTGLWEEEDDSGRKVFLFVTHTGGGYTVRHRQATGKDDVYTGVYFVPLGDLLDHTYAASLPTLANEAKARWLFVVKVRTNSLEVRIPSDDHLHKAARELGVPVGLDRALSPTANTDDVMRLLKKLAKDSFSGGKLYRRAGWFKDNDTDAVSMEQAESLIREGRGPDAASMLVYMATRGSAHAQLRVAQLHAKGSILPKSPEAAAWYFLAAHRTGHPDAAKHLAIHLGAHKLQEKGSEPFGSPLYWWNVAHLQAGENDTALQVRVREAAREQCVSAPVQY